MFSQTLEYALRAVVCLAQSAARDPQRHLTTAELSEITKVPASYLSKVMQSLVRGGIVSAVRGIGGGYVLAVPATDLCLLTVVNAIDPVKRIDTCPLGIEAHGSNLCPLHQRLDDVMEQAERAFAATTLAELIDAGEQEGASRPLGDSPEAVAASDG